MVMALIHDAAHAGHLGARKTRERLTRYFWWPGWAKDIDHFVTSCTTCQRNKRTTQLPYGNPAPFPPPEARWEVVTMDECGGLLTTPRGLSLIHI